MPVFLDTRGKSSLAIAICARCGEKYPYSDLQPDPNFPGLWVCDDDRDVLDPYRLSPRETEILSLDHARPDFALDGKQPIALYTGPIVPNYTIHLAPNGDLSADEIDPATTWQRLTAYQRGNTVTPLNPDDEAVEVPQNWFLCVREGISGASAPPWAQHSKPGQLMITDWQYLLSDDLKFLLSDDGKYLLADREALDGSVVWLNLGVYPL